MCEKLCGILSFVDGGSMDDYRALMMKSEEQQELIDEQAEVIEDLEDQVK
jgi:hypothetical protein